MSEFSLTASLAFLATIALIIVLKPAAVRLGLMDVPGGRKKHGTATPIIGGIAMFGGLVLTTLGMHAKHAGILPLVAACSILALVGALDDWGHVRKRTRLVAQLAAVLVMVYWGGIRIDSLGDLVGIGPIQLGFLAVPFTVFAGMGVINAVNMTDGADGLSGGLSLIACAFLAGIATVGGRLVDAQILVVLVCCLAAFMLFNYRFPGRKRAHVFMGDAGSTVVGFAICWFSISLSQGPKAIMPPIVSVWLLAIPVLDIVAVMIRRVLAGRSPFLPDRWHLHHILQRGGMPTARAVNWILCSAFLAAASAVMAYYGLSAPEAFLFVGLLAAAAVYIVTTQWRAAAVHGREMAAAPRAFGPFKPSRSVS